MDTKFKESIIDIAEHYGVDVQGMQCIEEMAELTVAINKYYRAKNNLEKSQNPPPTKFLTLVKAFENVVEEIADVQIMLWQLEYLLKVTGVDGVIEQKLERQLKRIKGE